MERIEVVHFKFYFILYIRPNKINSRFLIRIFSKKNKACGFCFFLIGRFTSYSNKHVWESKNTIANKKQQLFIDICVIYIYDYSLPEKIL